MRSLAGTDPAQTKNALVQAVVERALALAKRDFVQGRAEPTLTQHVGSLVVLLAATELAQAKNALVQAVVERALALAKRDFVQGRAEPTLAHNGGKL